MNRIAERFVLLATLNPDSAQLALSTAHNGFVLLCAALVLMMTPALAVDGSVKVVGKVPSVAELKTILRQAT